MLRGLPLAAVAALAAALHDNGTYWTIIAEDVGTIATGCAFVNAKHGYLPVSANGVGPELLHSRNGGRTWQNAKSEPFALLLLDIAAYDEYVAVVGALTMEYSLNNGTTFNSSLAQPGAGQCIRTIGPKGAEIGFAAVGQWGLFTEDNGVEVSYDAGITYASVNISDMVASARYGAFPSDTTWFVAAGDWPGEGSDDDPTDDDPPEVHTAGPMAGPALGALVEPSHYHTTVPVGSTMVKAQSSKWHLLQTPGKSGLLWARVKAEHVLAANTAGRTLPRRVSKGLGANTTWDAQVAKTTDGGKTWSVVYSKTGQFYLNGIECTSEQQCCTVAETGAGTTGGGTYIFCTSDGGSTWTETLMDSDDESSLTDIAAIGPSEYWAVGGEFTFIGPGIPHFYHTTDGGATWSLPNITNATEMLLMDAIAVDCVFPNATTGEAGNCWANLLDIATQESSIAALH